MEITKIASEGAGIDIASSNVVYLKSSKVGSSAGADQQTVREDRFVPSSAETEATSEILDTVSPMSTPGTIGTQQVDDPAREARVARVIVAVQNGTYQVDQKLLPMH